ncbi:hypothetical protein BTVI_78909 [Pitangus sulphuratus]|nr:hypothetical protein BTVI_78909 [Pitangus sulphuratus]
MDFGGQSKGEMSISMTETTAISVNGGGKWKRMPWKYRILTVLHPSSLSVLVPILQFGKALQPMLDLTNELYAILNRPEVLHESQVISGTVVLEQPGLSKAVDSSYVNEGVRRQNNDGMEKREERRGNSPERMWNGQDPPSTSALASALKGIIA